MATKHDEFKVYYFSFTDDEITKVVEGLRVLGDDDLADEIESEAYGGSDGDDSISVATLKFDVDTSDLKDATRDLENMKFAIDSFVEGYKRMEKVMAVVK